MKGGDEERDLDKEYFRLSVGKVKCGEVIVKVDTSAFIFSLEGE